MNKTVDVKEFVEANIDKLSDEVLINEIKKNWR